MRRLVLLVMALCSFWGMSLTAEAANWQYLTTQAYVEDVYYDKESVQLNGDTINVKLKTLSSKYASLYYILDARIVKVQLRPNSYPVHKIIIDNQHEYTKAGQFVATKNRNSFLGFVETDFRKYQAIIDYAEANAPVEAGKEASLKQKKLQLVLGGRPKVTLWVNRASIKDLPDGNMALEYFVETTASTIRIEGYVTTNNEMVATKYKAYVNGECIESVEAKDYNEKIEDIFGPETKDAIKFARYLQRTYNLH